MGLTISSVEQDRLHELCLSCFAHLTLVNDLYSYEKEYEAALAKGDPEWLNALNVIMQEHSINLDQAKIICRQRIKKAAAKFSAIVRSAPTDATLSVDVRRYLEALQYGMVGNLAWSMTCPRYHKTANYTVEQLKLMRDGAGKSKDNTQSSKPKRKADNENLPSEPNKKRKDLPTPPHIPDAQYDNTTSCLDSVLLVKDLPTLDSRVS